MRSPVTFAMASGCLINHVHRRANKIIIYFKVIEMLGCLARRVHRADPHHGQVV
jgi:hypothetical protein